MQLDVYEQRRKNLADLAQEGGGVVAFSRTHDIDSTAVSNLIRGSRTFTEKGARKLEHQIGLPEGYLDRDNSVEEGSLADIEDALSKKSWVDKETKAHVLWLLRKIKPEKGAKK